MKFSAAKLKGMNYKQLAIDHGEKLVLGLVALFVLAAIAGTTWSTYEKTPEELEAKVATAQESLRSGKWTDDERKTFSPDEDIRKDVDQLFGEIDTGKYSMAVPMLVQVVPRKEKIREPEWLPLETAIADAGQVILEHSTGPQMTADNTLAAGDPAAGTKPAAVDPRFEVRGQNAGQQQLPGTLPGDLAGAEAAGAGYGTTSEYGVASNIEGRGYRFVAVRGVVPFRRQLDRIAAAMHLPPGDPQLEQMVQYLDFKLERRRAVSGADPWSDWEAVDISVAKDVLTNVTDFEEDVVDAAVTSPVLTMPLPQRVMGYWRDFATHPRVKEFELTDEGRQQARLLNETLVKYAQELEKFQQSQPRAGGFSDLQLGMGQLRDEVMSTPEYQKKVMDDFNRQLNPQGGGFRPGQPNNLQVKITAAGQLMLFRYIDFDVEPGNAYQYRVQLVLQNPNFERSIDEVIDPLVAQEPVRTTPWSEPTAPVVVPEDVKYYLTSVENRPGRPIAAELDVYEWYPKTGTPVNAKLKLQQGHPIAATVKVPLPAPPVKFEEEEVRFETGDVLIDIDPAPKLDPQMAELHKDLQPSTGKLRLDIPDRTLVLNEFGELKPLDSQSLASARQQSSRDHEAFHAALEFLKKKEAEGADALSDLASIYADPAEGGADRKSRKRSRNPARRVDPAMAGP